MTRLTRKGHARLTLFTFLKVFRRVVPPLAVAMVLINIGNNARHHNTTAALTFAQTVCVGKKA
jgi:hypothetical protein